MISAEVISATLPQQGFEIVSENSKTIHFYSGEHKADVYVKVDTKTQPLVVHPDHQNIFSRLSSILGVIGSQPMTFYHNSTMRAFPERMNTGQKPTKYGLAFGFKTQQALAEFLDLLLNTKQNSILLDLSDIDNSDLKETEKESLRKARIGQGKFRSDLIEEFEGKCSLTGVGTPELLKASHIKPWSVCEGADERLSPANGLLLAANADALFDSGYISFSELGEITVSPKLKKSYLQKFGLSEELRLKAPISPSRRKFLSFHREHVFLK